MGNTLESPIVEKDSESFTSSEGLECGAAGMQGWRLEMEDAHISKNMPSRPDHLFLAVFDGHAGSGAAIYAAEHMISVIERQPKWAEYIEGGATNIGLLGDALKNAFLDIDVNIRAHQESTMGGDSSGCTSVTAMVTPTHILCANAGDSRCVMGTADTAKPLSDDHKPVNESERARIEKADGFVQWNRVNGDLAVSRALGDFSFKDKPELPAEEQKVTCLPDITVHERTSSDDILLLACDGLWDVMTTPEAVETAREILSSGESSMKLVAEELIDLSLNKGSKDNISAVVVKLPGAKVGPAEGGGVEKRRAARSAAQELKEQQPDNDA